MAGLVDKLIESQVNILTNDGRIFTGILKSFDQRMNIILGECSEQVYTAEGQAMHEEPVGVYFVRGDNIALVGQVDPIMEKNCIESGCLKGAPLPPMQLH